ncbi:hypothetical protein [Campylobacter phage CJLB-7]|nr:hypothetical protein [Campylobacter phage CJLB-7]
MHFFHSSPFSPCKSIIIFIFIYALYINFIFLLKLLRVLYQNILKLNLRSNLETLSNISSCLFKAHSLLLAKS